MRARSLQELIRLFESLQLTLTIDFPEEQTVAAKARAQGVSAEQYTRQVLEHDLAPEWLRNSWEISKQAGLNEISMEEIHVEIAAARSRRRREAPMQPGT